ncbi:hypothetical protein BDR26DRAFT_703311 [Obelidium mucronatum]|nr:hypothetical protein BDR26DRAFT_703311 [Obelidium mucronatum]
MSPPKAVQTSATSATETSAKDPQIDAVTTAMLVLLELANDCPSRQAESVNMVNSMGLSQTKVTVAMATNIQSLVDRACIISPKFQDLRKILKESLVVERLNLHSKEEYNLKLIPKPNCGKCGADLKANSPQEAGKKVVYTNEGTLIGLEYYYRCRIRNCSTRTYYSFYSPRTGTGIQGRYINLFAMEQPFFVSSRNTAFQISLLRRFDAALLLSSNNFHNFAAQYNYENNYIDSFKCSESGSVLDPADLPDPTDDDDNKEIDLNLKLGNNRISLNRKRLTEAWLLYRVPTMTNHHSLIPHLQDTTLVGLDFSNIQTLLESVVKPLKQSLQKYSAGHQCEKPGCSNTFIVDGNQKFKRSVCAEMECNSVEAYNVQFKLGCTNTPAIHSKYCKLHKEKAGRDKNSGTEEDDDTDSVVTRQMGTLSLQAESKDQDKISLIRYASINGAFHVHKIQKLPVIDGRLEVLIHWLNRECRVHDNPVTCHCEVTLEPLASILDKELRHQMKNALDFEWVTVASTTENIAGKKTAAKRVSSPGDCNTHKDNLVSKSKTAGNSLLTRPCHFILDIFELMRVESISQIYVQLVTFLEKTNINVAHIVFDDACHLGPLCVKNVKLWMETGDLTAEEEAAGSNLLKAVYVIDRMHEKGHVRAVCHTVYSANNPEYTELVGVNTESCEQIFLWWGKYRFAARHMNKERYRFFCLSLWQLHNVLLETKLRNSKWMK